MHLTSLKVQDKLTSESYDYSTFHVYYLLKVLRIYKQNDYNYGKR